jgi:hypothetical protein
MERKLADKHILITSASLAPGADAEFGSATHRQDQAPDGYRWLP